jgi:hypothetical protein
MYNESFVDIVNEIVGLRDRALAAWIGANHTTLSKYKQGSRTLPTHAMLPLTQLYTAVKNFPAVAEPTATEPEIAAMQKNVALSKGELFQLERQLATVKKQYTQASNLLQYVEAYSQSHTELTVQQQRWLDEQRYQAEQKMAKNGWMVQQQLHLKIAGLNQQIALMEALY